MRSPFRRAALVLGALLVAVACQDATTSPRATRSQRNAFDVGPATYGALWAITQEGLVLKRTVTPTGPVKASGVDSARAVALHAQLRGVAPTRALMSTVGPDRTIGGATSRLALRVRRISLGRIQGKDQALGVVPGEGLDAPLAALIYVSDHVLSAIVQLQHERGGNGKWRVKRSRTTVFNAQRRAVAVLDQSYGAPEFASAWRAGSLDLTKRFASLVLPDALYAAEEDDADAEVLCPTEFAASSAAIAAAGVASTNLVAAVAAEAAAVVALASAIAACPAGGCAVLAPLELASATATAALTSATLVSLAANATALVAAGNLAACLLSKRPQWITMWTGGTGGGGGEGGSGDGSGGGGGSLYDPSCEFYAYVDQFDVILWIENPNGCVVYAS